MIKNIKSMIPIITIPSAIIVFAFTNFQTKAESDRENQEKEKSFERVEGEIKDLHQDVKDSRLELNTKLDKIILHQIKK